MDIPYQALLLVSFGGPEQPADVMPFLENVTRGRNIPTERLAEVAEHYYHFGGRSPINEQNRALIAALQSHLAETGPDLPIYFGNRNWHPFLADTLRQMAQDGVTRALGLFTTAYSSYSSCRQYRENLDAARAEVGPTAPEIDKIRVFYNHPGFIEPQARYLKEALARSPEPPKVLFTAHSIPLGMAENCRYQQQLEEASQLVAESAGVADYELVYQSRSGPPSQPWLEPDVLERIRELHASGSRAVVLSPVGFISDHMEILFDLDTECRELCDELGMWMHRCPTVGVDPTFVAMLGELIRERCGLLEERRALGSHGPSHDVCPVNCCLYTPARRPAAPAQA